MKECSKKRTHLIYSSSVVVTYVYFLIPHLSRSPVSTNGLPSIGEDQPPSYKACLLFTGLGDNSYKPHTSSLMITKLKKEEEDPQHFYTLTLKDFFTLFCSFCYPFMQKGVGYLQTQRFQNWSQKYLFLDFRSIGGTIAKYSNTRRYHCLVQ